MDIVATRPHTLRTKGDAVAFALVLSEQYNGCGKPNSVDLGQAQEIFDFICKNVDLPDKEDDKQADFMADMSGFLKRIAEVNMMQTVE
jgi:hypothetical protein